ncbi:MAG: hypothetical protein AB7N54_09730 [Alphaproteobacteria bacterium]
MRIMLGAGDFGFADHTTDRTIACFEAGVLTGASIMARMPTTERAAAWARAVARRFTTTDRFYIPASTGDVDWAVPALAALPATGADTVEVGVHPGRDEAWRIADEDGAVAFAAAARKAGHELIGWRDLA